MQTNYQSTELNMAINQRDSKKANAMLIYKGAEDINSPDKNGDKPLHLATMVGLKEVVELLSRTDGVDINEPNKNGYTPLEIAIYYKQLGSLETLLNQAQCNFNEPDIDGNKPLHFASSVGFEEGVELLLKKMGVNINERNEDGYTPLEIAISKKHLEVVNTLLNQLDCNIDKLDKDGYKALHNAAKVNFSGAVIPLLETNMVNINELNEHGDSPLHIAICFKNTEFAKAILGAKNQLKEEISKNAVSEDNIKVDINLKNQNGYTALHLAVLHGLESVVKDLVKANADVTLTDAQGDTPLEIAQKHNMPNKDDNIIKILESAQSKEVSKKRKRNDKNAFSARRTNNNKDGENNYFKPVTYYDLEDTGGNPLTYPEVTNLAQNAQFAKIGPALPDPDIAEVRTPRTSIEIDLPKNLLQQLDDKYPSSRERNGR